MSTDTNKFEKYLKERLYRDLIFRSGIWIAISLSTGYIATASFESNPLEYFDRVGKILGSLVNTLGTFSLLICAPALMLKDLERTLKNPARISATIGYFGGAVRRLAGDLSLWTLGALITMLSTLTLTVLQIEIKASEYAAIASLAALLFLMSILVGIVNILVRREGPSPLLLKFNNPAHIVISYAILMIILIVGLLKNHA